MMNRRDGLLAGLALMSGACAGLMPRSARAQAVEKASAFMRQVGDRLTAIVNGSQTAGDKRRAVTLILDVAVDMEGIARFCLGRFWRTATPDQRTRYLEAFHEMMVTNISLKLGEYKGVKMSVQRGRQQDAEAIITTTVERPNNPPASVDWVITQPTSAPRIVDLIAEGTSLRLTQRQDYASYLSRNNNNIDALVAAMKQQAEQNR